MVKKNFNSEVEDFESLFEDNDQSSDFDEQYNSTKNESDGKESPTSSLKEQVFNTQDSARNQAAERILKSSDPALTDDSSKLASTLAEKVRSLEKISKYVEQAESGVNNTMAACNDIRRDVKPLLDKGLFVNENISRIIAQKGHDKDAVINMMRGIISDLRAQFSNIKGEVDLIVQNQLRIETSIQDIKNETKKT